MKLYTLKLRLTRFSALPRQTVAPVQRGRRRYILGKQTGNNSLEPILAAARRRDTSKMITPSEKLTSLSQELVEVVTTTAKRHATSVVESAIPKMGVCAGRPELAPGWLTKKLKVKEVKEASSSSVEIVISYFAETDFANACM